MKWVAVIACLLLTGSLSAQQSTSCALSDAPVAVTRCEPYMIYVADFGRSRIERILSRHFEGFTIVPARGCWKGKCEGSVVIEIAGTTEEKVRAAAEELRTAGKQQSVIVVVPRAKETP